MKGFEEFWGFPQVAGAIDGSHIPIIRRVRPITRLVVMQGLVDAVACSWMCASVGHDARVFTNSSL